ncbi:MAG TPA: DUF4214 domain-containing protein [Pyrinomonadaceae bacterium]|nr:DUF4214 domain-containing protein [Pyrinomonadaceae bacterium]
MRHLLTLVTLAATLVWPLSVSRAYTLQYTDRTGAVQIRWPTKTINISLSTSLNSPPPNIKPGSDVVGAARRALKSWSEAANIQFNIGFSDAQASTQDGVSLITVSPVNSTLFNVNNAPQGRARITFDPNSGAIQEGDVAINPTASAQFSTDGTPGTFDLEATLAHELGHLLGLEHSGIVAATTQPRQGTNGVYAMPALTSRTLSDDDRAGARAIDGPRDGQRGGRGTIAGTARYASGAAAFGAHVFVEDVATGRTVASNIALPTGDYRIDALPPGQYRVRAEYLDEPVNAGQIASRSGAYQGLTLGSTAPFLTTEVGTFTVSAGATTPLDVSVPTGQQFMNASLLGTNDQLSAVPVPVVPGRTHRILVAGENVHNVPTTGVSVNSPHVTVVQSTVQKIFFGGLQVLSFDVRVAITAPPGDYSIRLRSATETSYVTGGLTVDLPFGVTSGNPIDNAQFFVAQHYRDFFGREPDAAGLAFWADQITSCGTNQACREVRTINVSAAFFLSIEFQETGFLAYRLYRASYGRFPRFREFLPDSEQIGRGVVVGEPGAEARLEQNKQAFINEFVNRPEFLAQYPTTMTPEQFVDTLNVNTGGSLSQPERDDLVNRLRNGALTRAQVLRAVVDDADFRAREKNRAFVLMQYFGYLRRNPDDPPNTDFAGFNFWLGKLNEFNGDFIAAEMVKAFITSGEYRARFGPS